MFERYTEKARRVIFFARYEASQFGSPCIETEHLLLGLLRGQVLLGLLHILQLLAHFGQPCLQFVQSVVQRLNLA